MTAPTELVHPASTQLEITFPWLIDTLLRLSNERTEILLCYKKRRNADKHFFSLLRKHFTFSHVRPAHLFVAGRLVDS